MNLTFKEQEVRVKMGLVKKQNRDRKILLSSTPLLGVAKIEGIFVDQIL
jgi:hypothetical protein